MELSEIIISVFTLGLILGVALGQVIPRKKDALPKKPDWNEFYFRLACKNMLDRAEEIE